MDLDKGLNGGMKYIAIDFTQLQELTSEEKNNIINSLEKYDVPVMEATFEELKKQGMYNENTMSIEGVLLNINEVERTEDKVTIKGSKYRSGKGAIGVESYLIKKTEIWELKEAKITWIS
ncbi:MAG: hypothetical protein JM58_15345 [Peptococcaceae bacterium BICA1-8]|nr:MAG: hypothetical protein JM58_15345 [Peptococcaceae bacterium BICA1-8]